MTLSILRKLRSNLASLTHSWCHRNRRSLHGLSESTWACISSCRRPRQAMYSAKNGRRETMVTSSFPNLLGRTSHSETGTRKESLTWTLLCLRYELFSFISISSLIYSTKAVQQNGSLWADIFLVKNGADPDPSSPNFSPSSIHHVRKRRKFNLKVIFGFSNIWFSFNKILAEA